MPLYSIAVLVTVILFSFAGPFFYTFSPHVLDSQSILLAPSFSHWFGTDRLGRDLLARLMVGGQISLTIGFMSALIATLIGLIYGVSAALF